MRNDLLQIEGTCASQRRTDCPSCGQIEMEGWLSSPDRFHGKTQQYKLLRCPTCSVVLLDKPPTPSEMKYHYGTLYDRFIGRAGDTSPERWLARRMTISKYKSGGNLLDLGCSSGSFLETMKGQDWNLFGIEMSPSAARKAESRSGAQISVGDVLESRYESRFFDVITCFDVMEHVYEPQKVMAKVCQWLKPDGIFYMLVPNIDSAEARVFGSYWYGLELPRHLTHFSPRSLIAVANAAGLEEVSVRTGRNSAVEYTFGYVLDDLMRKLGSSRVPLAARPAPNIAWRIIRKGIRSTILPAARFAVSFAGDGESIHAIFRRKSGGLVSEKTIRTANRL